MNLDKHLIANIQNFQSNSDRIYILEKVDGTLYKADSIEKSPYLATPINSTDFLEILNKYQLVGDRNLEQRFGFLFNDLSAKEKEGLFSGKKEDLIQISLNKNNTNRDFLDNEKIDYKESNEKVSFSSRISVDKSVTAENNEELKRELARRKIKFHENGTRLHIVPNNISKLLKIGLFLVNPLLATAIILRPKRKNIKKDISLKRSDIKKLKEGLVVPKQRNGENILLQVDQSTNEVVTVKARNVSIPNKIDGLSLSPLQKESLKKGKAVGVSNEKGEKFILRLDLNSKNGIHKIRNEESKGQNYGFIFGSNESRKMKI